MTGDLEARIRTAVRAMAPQLSTELQLKVEAETAAELSRLPVARIREQSGDRGLGGVVRVLALRSLRRLRGRP